MLNSIAVTQAILAFTDNFESFYNLIAWLNTSHSSNSHDTQMTQCFKPTSGLLNAKCLLKGLKQ